MAISKSGFSALKFRSKLIPLIFIPSLAVRISAVVQRNASSSEEVAATSEELSAQSNVLADSVSFFKTA
jgi:hypothetical protein